MSAATLWGSRPPFLLFVFLALVNRVDGTVCGLPSAFASLPSSHSSPALVPSSSSPSFDPFSLSACACDSDWADAFCSRVHEYAQMEAERAPSVCVCRKMMAGGGDCVQLLTRCFRHRLLPAPIPTHNQIQHRPIARHEQCTCCVNQPDVFCTQLDCAQMHPQFDAAANTSCRCHLPGDSPDLPEDLDLCGEFGQHWPRGVTPSSSGADESLPGALPTSKRPSPFLAGLFRSTSPMARVLSLLLLALFASLVLALSVCAWSHWRRLAERRKGAENKEETGTEMTREGNTASSAENALLREATTV